MLREKWSQFKKKDGNAATAVEEISPAALFSTLPSFNEKELPSFESYSDNLTKVWKRLWDEKKAEERRKIFRIPSKNIPADLVDLLQSSKATPDTSMHEFSFSSTLLRNDINIKKMLSKPATSFSGPQVRALFNMEDDHERGGGDKDRLVAHDGLPLALLFCKEETQTDSRAHQRLLVALEGNSETKASWVALKSLQLISAALGLILPPQTHTPELLLQISELTKAMVDTNLISSNIQSIISMKDSLMQTNLEDFKNHDNNNSTTNVLWGSRIDRINAVRLIHSCSGNSTCCCSTEVEEMHSESPEASKSSPTAIISQKLKCISEVKNVPFGLFGYSAPPSLHEVASIIAADPELFAKYATCYPNEHEFSNSPFNLNKIKAVDQNISPPPTNNVINHKKTRSKNFSNTQLEKSANDSLKLNNKSQAFRIPLSNRPQEYFPDRLFLPSPPHAAAFYPLEWSSSPFTLPVQVATILDDLYLEHNLDRPQIGKVVNCAFTLAESILSFYVFCVEILQIDTSSLPSLPADTPAIALFRTSVKSLSTSSRFTMPSSSNSKHFNLDTLNMNNDPASSMMQLQSPTSIHNIMINTMNNSNRSPNGHLNLSEYNTNGGGLEVQDFAADNTVRKSGDGGLLDDLGRAGDTANFHQHPLLRPELDFISSILRIIDVADESDLTRILMSVRTDRKKKEYETTRSENEGSNRLASIDEVESNALSSSEASIRQGSNKKAPFIFPNVENINNNIVNNSSSNTGLSSDSLPQAQPNKKASQRRISNSSKGPFPSRQRQYSQVGSRSSMRSDASNKDSSSRAGVIRAWSDVSRASIVMLRSMNDHSLEYMGYSGDLDTDEQLFDVLLMQEELEDMDGDSNAVMNGQAFFHSDANDKTINKEDADVETLNSNVIHNVKKILSTKIKKTGKNHLEISLQNRSQQQQHSLNLPDRDHIIRYMMGDDEDEWLAHTLSKKNINPDDGNNFEQNNNNINSSDNLNSTGNNLDLTQNENFFGEQEEIDQNRQNNKKNSLSFAFGSDLYRTVSRSNFGPIEDSRSQTSHTGGGLLEDGSVYSFTSSNQDGFHINENNDKSRSSLLSPTFSGNTPQNLTKQKVSRQISNNSLLEAVGEVLPNMNNNFSSSHKKLKPAMVRNLLVSIQRGQESLAVNHAHRSHREFVRYQSFLILWLHAPHPSCQPHLSALRGHNTNTSACVGGVHGSDVLLEIMKSDLPGGGKTRVLKPLTTVISLKESPMDALRRLIGVVFFPNGNGDSNSSTVERNLNGSGTDKKHFLTGWKDLEGRLMMSIKSATHSLTKSASINGLNGIPCVKSIHSVHLIISSSNRLSNSEISGSSALLAHYGDPLSDSYIDSQLQSSLRKNHQSSLTSNLLHKPTEVNNLFNGTLNSINSDSAFDNSRGINDLKNTNLDGKNEDSKTNINSTTPNESSHIEDHINNNQNNVNDNKSSALMVQNKNSNTIGAKGLFSWFPARLLVNWHLSTLTKRPFVEPGRFGLPLEGIKLKVRLMRGAFPPSFLLLFLQNDYRKSSRLFSQHATQARNQSNGYNNNDNSSELHSLTTGVGGNQFAEHNPFAQDNSDISDDEVLMNASTVGGRGRKYRGGRSRLRTPEGFAADVVWSASPSDVGTAENLFRRTERELAVKETLRNLFPGCIELRVDCVFETPLLKNSGSITVLTVSSLLVMGAYELSTLVVLGPSKCIQPIVKGLIDLHHCMSPSLKPGMHSDQSAPVVVSSHIGSVIGGVRLHLRGNIGDISEVRPLVGLVRPFTPRSELESWMVAAQTAIDIRVDAIHFSSINRVGGGGGRSTRRASSLADIPEHMQLGDLTAGNFVSVQSGGAGMNNVFSAGIPASFLEFNARSLVDQRTYLYPTPISAVHALDDIVSRCFIPYVLADEAADAILSHPTLMRKVNKSQPNRNMPNFSDTSTSNDLKDKGRLQPHMEPSMLTEEIVFVTATPPDSSDDEIVEVDSITNAGVDSDSAASLLNREAVILKAKELIRNYISTSAKKDYFNNSDLSSNSKNNTTKGLNSNSTSNNSASLDSVFPFVTKIASLLHMNNESSNSPQSLSTINELSNTSLTSSIFEASLLLRALSAISSSNAGSDIISELRVVIATHSASIFKHQFGISNVYSPETPRVKKNTKEGGLLSESLNLFVPYFSESIKDLTSRANSILLYFTNRNVHQNSSDVISKPYDFTFNSKPSTASQFNTINNNAPDVKSTLNGDEYAKSFRIALAFPSPPSFLSPCLHSAAILEASLASRIIPALESLLPSARLSSSAALSHAATQVACPLSLTFENSLVDPVGSLWSFLPPSLSSLFASNNQSNAPVLKRCHPLRALAELEVSLLTSDLLGLPMTANDISAAASPYQLAAWLKIPESTAEAVWNSAKVSDKNMSGLSETELLSPFMSLDTLKTAAANVTSQGFGQYLSPAHFSQAAPLSADILQCMLLEDGTIEDLNSDIGFISGQNGDLEIGTINALNGIATAQKSAGGAVALNSRSSQKLSSTNEACRRVSSRLAMSPSSCERTFHDASLMVRAMSSQSDLASDAPTACKAGLVSQRGSVLWTLIARVRCWARTISAKVRLSRVGLVEEELPIIEKSSSKLSPSAFTVGGLDTSSGLNSTGVTLDNAWRDGVFYSFALAQSIMSVLAENPILSPSTNLSPPVRLWLIVTLTSHLEFIIASLKPNANYVTGFLTKSDESKLSAPLITDASRTHPALCLCDFQTRRAAGSPWSKSILFPYPNSLNANTKAGSPKAGVTASATTSAGSPASGGGNSLSLSGAIAKLNSVTSIMRNGMAQLLYFSSFKPKEVNIICSENYSLDQIDILTSFSGPLGIEYDVNAAKSLPTDFNNSPTLSNAFSAFTRRCVAFRQRSLTSSISIPTQSFLYDLNDHSIALPVTSNIPSVKKSIFNMSSINSDVNFVLHQASIATSVVENSMFSDRENPLLSLSENLNIPSNQSASSIIVNGYGSSGLSWLMKRCQISVNESSTETCSMNLSDDKLQLRNHPMHQHKFSFCLKVSAHDVLHYILKAQFLIEARRFSFANRLQTIQNFQKQLFDSIQNTIQQSQQNNNQQTQQNASNTIPAELRNVSSSFLLDSPHYISLMMLREMIISPLISMASSQLNIFEELILSVFPQFSSDANCCLDSLKRGRLLIIVEDMDCVHPLIQQFIMFTLTNFPSNDLTNSNAYSLKQAPTCMFSGRSDAFNPNLTFSFLSDISGPNVASPLSLINSKFNRRLEFRKKINAINKIGQRSFLIRSMMLLNTFVKKISTPKEKLIISIEELGADFASKLVFLRFGMAQYLRDVFTAPNNINTPFRPFEIPSSIVSNRAAIQAINAELLKSKWSKIIEFIGCFDSLVKVLITSTHDPLIAGCILSCVMVASNFKSELQISYSIDNLALDSIENNELEISTPLLSGKKKKSFYDESRPPGVFRTSKGVGSPGLAQFYHVMLNAKQLPKGYHVKSPDTLTTLRLAVLGLEPGLITSIGTLNLILLILKSVPDSTFVYSCDTILREVNSLLKGSKMANSVYNLSENVSSVPYSNLTTIGQPNLNSPSRFSPSSLSRCIFYRNTLVASTLSQRPVFSLPLSLLSLKHGNFHTTDHLKSVSHNNNSNLLMNSTLLHPLNSTSKHNTQNHLGNAPSVYDVIKQSMCHVLIGHCDTHTSPAMRLQSDDKKLSSFDFIQGSRQSSMEKNQNCKGSNSGATANINNKMPKKSNLSKRLKSFRFELHDPKEAAHSLDLLLSDPNLFSFLSSMPHRLSNLDIRVDSYGFFTFHSTVSYFPVLQKY